MRQIDSSMVREDNLILLTSRDLSDRAPLMAADFSDMQALVFVQTGSWIGANARGILLGKGPAEMVDGIWYVTEDQLSNELHPNTQLSTELLSLEIIK